MPSGAVRAAPRRLFSSRSKRPAHREEQEEDGRNVDLISGFWRPPSGREVKGSGPLMGSNKSAGRANVEPKLKIVIMTERSSRSGSLSRSHKWPLSGPPGGAPSGGRSRMFLERGPICMRAGEGQPSGHLLAPPPLGARIRRPRLGWKSSEQWRSGGHSADELSTGPRRSTWSAVHHRSRPDGRRPPVAGAVRPRHPPATETTTHLICDQPTGRPVGWPVSVN